MDLRPDFINYVKHKLMPRPELPLITNKYKDIKSRYMPINNPGISNTKKTKNNTEGKPVPWKKIFGS
jgi:hypothetical protein